MFGSKKKNKENEMFELVKKVIIDSYGDGYPINMNSNLVTDLEFDSLDIVDIVMCLEDEIEGEITDDLVEKWNTIEDIVKDLIKIKN